MYLYYSKLAVLSLVVYCLFGAPNGIAATNSADFSDAFSTVPGDSANTKESDDPNVPITSTESNTSQDEPKSDTDSVTNLDEKSAQDSGIVEATSTEPLALTWYREKAQKGDRDAQFNIGMMFETGFGVVVDEKTAVKWYTDAAKQGHAEAQLKLGMLYIAGLGVKESPINGGKWIRSASRGSNAFARILVDKLLSKDLPGVETKNAIVAIRNVYNKKNAKQAEDKLFDLLARAEIEKKNKGKKERFTEGVTGSAAKNGTVGNQVPDFLAEKKVPSNLIAGDKVSQLRRLAKDGDADAQYDWGKMLETGESVPVDKVQAVKWYAAAAAQDHAGGQYRLALAFIYGIGTKPDAQQGGALLQKSAAQKYPLAETLLKYVSISNNRITGYSTSVSLPWRLEQAMIQKDGDAMLALSYMFHNGWGVTRNPEEGKNWMQKARSSGSKTVSTQLRQMRVDELMNKSDSSSDGNRSRIVKREAPTSANQSNNDIVSQSADKEARRSAQRQRRDARLPKELQPELSAVDKGKNTVRDLTKRFGGKEKLEVLGMIALGLLLAVLFIRYVRRQDRRLSDDVF